jgi:DNA-binding NarL/FixJ family response regulator
LFPARRIIASRSMVMTDPTIRVLLVEDNPIHARLIGGLLSTEPSVKFTWQQVEQLNSATEILRTEPFDLVLLDLSLPDSDGLDTFTNLYPHAICLPIIVLTNLRDDPLALLALQAGAQDYFVMGQMDGELLLHALRPAMERKRNEISLRLRILELMAVAQQLESAMPKGGLTEENKPARERMKLTSREADLLKALSSREREILRLVAEGKTSRDIADTLSISPKTVDTYRSRLMRKIGVENLAALVKFAIRHGVISLE